MKPLTPILLSVFFLAACSGDTKSTDSDADDTPNYGPVDVGLRQLAMSHDGEQRDFFLYVPSSYDGGTALPVMFAFHGNGGYAEDFVYMADMRSLADSEGFFVVYPQGLILDGEGTHWNPMPDGILSDNKSEVDDIGFTEAILDSLPSKYNFDQDRVYATGYSNGAGLAYSLGCFLSDRFAAVAPVSGLMYEAAAANCDTTHPTSVFVFNGTDDGTRPYAGYPGYMMGVDDVVSYWAGHNNTNPSPTTTNVSSNNTTIEHRVYSDGDGDSSVQLYKVINGGHDWFYLNVDGKNIQQLIWEFASQHGAR